MVGKGDEEGWWRLREVVEVERGGGAGHGPCDGTIG